MTITTKFSCGDTIWVIQLRRIEGPYLVGKVSVGYTAAQDGPDPDSAFDNLKAQKETYLEKYMCFQTGVGSGYVYSVDLCFASREEAKEGLLAIIARDELAEMPEGD